MNQHLSPEELGKLFFEIDNQPSLKLSELAKVAGLSIAEDYIGADLSKEDLSEDNLSNANFSNANLSNSNLSHVNLENANLSSVNLCDADLRNADLSHANLNGADLTNADLTNANLSNANLFGANLYNTNLRNANLSHVNFGCANLLNAKNLTTANLSHAILTTATLGLSQKERLILKQQGVIVADAADSFSNVQGSVIQGNQNQGSVIQVLITTAGQVSTFAVSEYGQYNFSTALEAEKLAQNWHERLAAECPDQSVATRDSIIIWLLGRDCQRFEVLNSKELDIAKQAMEYRYRILVQRYLGMSRERAYRNLINRLGSVVTLRNKIQTWISLSRDRQRSVMDVLQEVLQELLQNDNYIQEQMVSIAELTKDKRLGDNLLFASIEEYSLRPVRNQPLVAYRFVNYLRRTQRGGLTQVPGSDLIRLVSEEVIADDSDNRVNLVDHQAIAEYQEAQELEEQQALREAVKQEFETYLEENLGPEAVQWLQLYLQGKTQDEIAKTLNKQIKEVYRLREKISYHAVRVFALKNKPELVENWLSISLEEHNLGLTQNQWQQLYGQLTQIGQQILDLRRAGNSIEAIAQQLKLKAHQVMGEWTKVYLVAQSLRNQE